MNPGFAVVLLVVTFSQGDPLVAQRTEFTPEQQEVIKVSQAWNDAYNRRDLETYSGYMSEAFIGTTEESSMNKAGLVKFVRGRPQKYQQRQDPREYEVHIDGESAVLTYLVTSVHGWGDTSLTFQVRRMEVFKKKPGEGWLAIASQQCNLPVNLRAPAQVDSKTLQDYVGEYDWPRHDAQDIDRYTIEGGRLMTEWRGEKRESLPMGKDKFFTRDDLGWTTFVRNAQGRVMGYVYTYADGQELTAKKIK